MNGIKGKREATNSLEVDLREEGVARTGRVDDSATGFLEPA